MVECRYSFLNGRIEWSSTISFTNHLPWLVFMDTEFFTPFDETHALSINFNHVIFSGVTALLLFGCPVTISRLIIAVIVFTIYRMLWARFWSHIREEVFETISPSIADRYAARSVDRIFMVCWNVATGFHRTPTVIFPTVRSIMRSVESITSKKLGRSFLSKAATTLCSFSNVRRCCNGDVSAIALAFPHNIPSAFNFHALNHQKSVKPVSR